MSTIHSYVVRPECGAMLAVETTRGGITRVLYDDDLIAVYFDPKEVVAPRGSVLPSGERNEVSVDDAPVPSVTVNGRALTSDLVETVAEAESAPERPIASSSTPFNVTMSLLIAFLLLLQRLWGDGPVTHPDDARAKIRAVVEASVANFFPPFDYRRPVGPLSDEARTCLVDSAMEWIEQRRRFGRGPDLDAVKRCIAASGIDIMDASHWYGLCAHVDWRQRRSGGL